LTTSKNSLRHLCFCKFFFRFLYPGLSAIVGDFNAKTGTLNDFIIPDETLLDLFNLDSDDDVLSYMLDYENLENQDVPLFHCVFVGCCDVLLLFMFGVTDDCKVMCIGLCTSDSKGSKSCISNSFTKENNFDDIKK
jgi:hypothetical protein